MTNFDDLQHAYTTEPGRIFEPVDAMAPQTRLDMLLANLGAGRRANRLAEKNANLPDAYRRSAGGATRWDAFENLLTFDRDMLATHMAPHVTLEAHGGTYIRNTLALLVWKTQA